MKRFFALAALVLGLAACQTEPEGLDVNVGGEVDTTITVSLPETTRATNSAEGAFANVDLTGDATIRYILKIYQKVGAEYVASDDRQVEYSDEKSVVFPVRLVPNRDYRFVVWADYVEGEADDDYHYNTADLTKIELMGEWNPMDETRDAFTGYFDTAVEGQKYTGASSINIALTRPFAKLRVITTDMEQLNDLGIEPKTATVEYKVSHYNAFNAFAGEAIGDSKNRNIKHENFTIKAYGDNVNDESMVLFTDYFFANNDVVKFDLTVVDQNGTVIDDTIAFNTDINVKRNHLTTITGDILTDGNNIKVNVEDDFANEYIYIEGDYTLTENMFIDRPLVVRPGTSAVLDLNGHTITADLKQEDRHHYAIDNYGTLTLEGEGAINARGIENFGTMTINGNITITNVDTNGGSAIWNEGNLVINGGTFTTNAEAGVDSYGGALYTTEGGSAVINGGNFIANSQLTYAICNYGETVINNATVKGKHGAVASADGAAYKTTINGGSFELMENPNVSDHCVYYVSEIKGGRFTLGTNTDNGAQVFYASTIAEGCVVEADGDWFNVIYDPYYGYTKVANIDQLKDAIKNATADINIVFLNDIVGDVELNNTNGKITINGDGKTYTGIMTLKSDATFKNVNFDGKGLNNYAITTRGTYYLTIEDCTAKNYGFGFVQLASATVLTTVKNVTVSNMNYGVKVDYSNAVVIENAQIDAAVAAVLNSNYGEKTITIKNSNLNILGTWTRNNTTKTNYVFEGNNSIATFIIDAAIDNFKLAAGATLTAPNEITVTTVDGYTVEYADGKYISK